MVNGASRHVTSSQTIRGGPNMDGWPSGASDRDEDRLASDGAEAATPAEAEAILAAMAACLFPESVDGFDKVTWTEAAPGVRSGAATVDARVAVVEARFRTLIEQIPAVTFMAALGEGKNEVYVSPHIEALLGYSQAEWLENPVLWYSRLHPDDRKLWNEEFTRGCQTGGPFRAECRLLARSGRVVWVHGEARLARDDRGRPMFLQGVAFDITESKRTQEALVADAIVLEQRVAERTRELLAANEDLAREIADRKRVEAALGASEQQLRQSQKMEAIGRLAGGVAHDFNNLLSIILSYSELLGSRLPPDSPVVDGLREIEHAAEQAAALTAQLLAFGRKQLLAPSVVDLNVVVSGMRDMLVRLVGEDIEVRVRLAPELRRVEVDRRQVEQVLLNLVVNARDAMPEGGTLVVEVDNVDLGDEYAAQHPGVVPGPHAMLSVADTGIGMDASTRARLFEPFFTTKEIGKGTGLGLSTVFGIVQQSGGSISVESEVGEGARFRVYFPSVDAQAEFPATEPVHRDAGGTETILLVEDDAQVRSLVQSLLKARGYSVLDAANAREAEFLSEQFSGEIHMLLTDVVMPKVNGRKLAEMLAVSRPAMRTLFMSGYTDDAVVRNGVGATGAALLQKPITPRALAEKVRQVLDAAPLSSRAGLLARPAS
jgi:two-component system, cell cycle sensor histidine kinase and response regulator CckA